MAPRCCRFGLRVRAPRLVRCARTLLLLPLLPAAAASLPRQDYMDPNIPTKGFFTNVRYMFDLRDVVVDVQGETNAARARGAALPACACVPLRAAAAAALATKRPVADCCLPPRCAGGAHQHHG